MFWAVDPKTGQRIKAEPGLTGICPGCYAPVLAKCGSLTLWHWAHLPRPGRGNAGADCDPWSEHESEWHYSWKSRVPDEMREYVIKREIIDPSESRFLVHRADILNSRGTVIELQHSFLSTDQIKEREEFYQNMIWIWDAREFNFVSPRRLDDGHRYEWKWPKKSLWACKKPLWLHFGGQKLFRVRSFSRVKPYYVSGVHESSFKDFLSIFFK